MAGGYRVLIVGALAALLFTVFGFGWVAANVSGNSDELRGLPYRYATEKPSGLNSVTLSDASAMPIGYRTPCDNPKGREESDLCAQWTSANAAEDSAFWTKWGFWIAVVGSTLLLWQIILTRRAVEDTTEATNAMHEANVIAARTAERQLRPYVSCEGVSWDKRKDLHGALTIPAQISWKNFGQTPTLNLQIQDGFVILDGDIDDPQIDWVQFGTTPLRHYALGPSQGIKSSGIVIGADDLEAIWKRKKTLVMAGTATYQDDPASSIRTTKICYRVLIYRSDAEDSFSYSWLEWQICGPHNGAD